VEQPARNQQPVYMRLLFPSAPHARRAVENAPRQPTGPTYSTVPKHRTRAERDGANDVTRVMSSAVHTNTHIFIGRQTASRADE
jgi:hypothetical protein